MNKQVRQAVLIDEKAFRSAKQLVQSVQKSIGVIRFTFLSDTNEVEIEVMQLPSTRSGRLCNNVQLTCRDIERARSKRRKQEMSSRPIFCEVTDIQLMGRTS